MAFRSDERGAGVLAGYAESAAVGGHHDDRQIGAPLLDLPQQRKSVHAGHVDVRENDDQLRLDAGELVQRILTGTREMQHVLASLKLIHSKERPRAEGQTVNSGGKKLYIFQHRMGGRGTPRKRYTIGALTPEQARKEVEWLKGLICTGKDPAHEKRAIQETHRRDAAAKKSVETIEREFIHDICRSGNLESRRGAFLNVSSSRNRAADRAARLSAAMFSRS
jgi:Arm domain-containing DNA-binding protein